MGSISSMMSKSAPRTNSRSPSSHRSSRRHTSQNSAGSPAWGPSCFGHDFQPAHYSFADDAALDRAEAPAQPDEETLPSGPLALSARLEYASLRKGEAYNVFALVNLLAAEMPAGTASAAAVERAPVDITCILDVSGSMSGPKIQLVKEAVMFVIDEMLPGDRLSIVSFNNQAQRHICLTRMTAEGKDALRQATMRLHAGGGTSIAAGLDCGIASMEQRRQRNPVGALFLLTDGQDGSSRSQVQGLAERARAAHCALYAFGFGQDHDAALLSSVAEAAQTPFTFVEQPDSIKAAFAGAVSGLMSVTAQSIEVRIAPASGCALTALHTHFPHRREGAADGPAVVSIPDAFAGEQRNIVVELCVPASAAGEGDGAMALMRASVRYRAVQEQAIVQSPEVTLEAPRTAEPEGEPDVEVTAQRQRVEVTDALEAAIKHGEEGRFEQAQEVLRSHVERLRKGPAGATRLSQALLAEVEDAQTRLSSAEAWQQGGRAEVTDAMWCHRGERCTTTVAAKKKSSKSLYATTMQKSTIRRSQM